MLLTRALRHKSELFIDAGEVLVNVRRAGKLDGMAALVDLEKPCNIQTFAVLDLETTGLPHLEFNKTRITELSLIAATRKHVIEAESSEEKLPRVLQKLNLCIYPNKRISLASSQITGLYNDTLEECSPFDDDVFILLDAFFRRLPQPVCIISHNGLRFDFPILQTELRRLGKELPGRILCADSLTAFRQLLGQKVIPNGVSRLEQENAPTAHLTHSDGYDNILYDMVAKVELQCLENTDCSLHVECSGMKIDYKQEDLEKTPSQGVVSSHVPPKLKPLEKKKNAVEKTGNRVRKRLFEDTEVKTLKKFKLGDIYEFLLGKKPLNCHHAEGDTLGLLQCIVVKGSQFIEWTDNNAKLFNEIPKLS